jgi:hypothetical protein
VSAQHNSSEEGSGNSSEEGSGNSSHVEGSAGSNSMDISDESALFEVVFSLAFCFCKISSMFSFERLICAESFKVS